MSNTLFGIGTTFYGKDDIRPDGSFIATKWIVFAYIPLVPLGSFYVRPIQSARGTVSTSLPPVTQRMSWQKQHIRNVYAFMGVIAIVLFMINYRANTPTTAAAVPARIGGKGAALPPDRSTSEYIRPLKAENGSLFPAKSDYIIGYEQLANEDYATLTINNTENTSDLYLKLYALDGDYTTPVRVFFVIAEGEFTLEDLNVGDYELRYQDLDTGGFAKTEPLPLKMVEKADGTYFSNVEVILSKVVNGNLETEPILEEDF